MTWQSKHWASILLSGEFLRWEKIPSNVMEDIWKYSININSAQCGSLRLTIDSADYWLLWNRNRGSSLQRIDTSSPLACTSLSSHLLIPVRWFSVFLYFSDTRSNYSTHGTRLSILSRWDTWLMDSGKTICCLQLECANDKPQASGQNLFVWTYSWLKDVFIC